jgi:hypothetical protein
MYTLQENALTDGARALAKHACRSSSGYWGSLVGNGKNSLLKEKLLDISLVIAFQTKKELMNKY